MLNYSTRFKELIRSDVRDILYELNIALVDGTSLSINNSQLWGDSLSLEDGTSESGKFTVGAAVSTKLSFGLNNIYGDFNDYSFDRASVVLKIGMMVDGTKEMVQVGKFIVDDADYDSSIISITALDNFIKMDSVVGTISFPTDTRTLVQNICTNCGVTNLADSFLANHNYTIKSFDYSNMTYRALLVYLCQYMGCFAKIDSQGRLTLNWYNDIFDEEEHEGIEVIDSFKSLKLSTDNIVISGVEVVLDDEHSYSLGTQNYVVVVSNNPVIVDEEMAQSLVNRLYVQIGGYSFKKCNADALMYLWLESGDSIYVKDKDVKYPIFISNRTLNSNGSVSFSCDAETPLRNGSVGNDSNASAIRQLRQDLKKEKNDRERVEEELREEIAGAGGIYETEVDGSEGEGGKIKYLHNKPLLSDSAIQWKFTASTISVSKDYGETWSFALNSNGQAILNQIYALGINADYVQTGYIKGLNEFKVQVYKTKTDGTYSGLTNSLVLSSTSSNGVALTNMSENLNYNTSNKFWMRTSATQEITSLGNYLKQQNADGYYLTNFLNFTTNTVDKSSGSSFIYNCRYNDSNDTYGYSNYIGLANGGGSANTTSSINLVNYANKNSYINANEISMNSTYYSSNESINSTLNIRNYNSNTKKYANLIYMSASSSTSNSFEVTNYLPSYDGTAAASKKNLLSFSGNTYNGKEYLTTKFGNFYTITQDGSYREATYNSLICAYDRDSYNQSRLVNASYSVKYTFNRDYNANEVKLYSTSSSNYVNILNNSLDATTLANEFTLSSASNDNYVWFKNKQGSNYANSLFMRKYGDHNYTKIENYYSGSNEVANAIYLSSGNGLTLQNKYSSIVMDMSGHLNLNGNDGLTVKSAHWNVTIDANNTYADGSGYIKLNYARGLQLNGYSVYLSGGYVRYS